MFVLFNIAAQNLMAFSPSHLQLTPKPLVCADGAVGGSSVFTHNRSASDATPMDHSMSFPVVSSFAKCTTRSGL